MRATARGARAARSLHVTGVVQGVGFRPFVHRLAVRHGLAGWVLNRAGDVEIRVEGEREPIEAFCAALTAEAPPLSQIERVRSAAVSQEGARGFGIRGSTDDRSRRQPVPADVGDLRGVRSASCSIRPTAGYGYPFITCTDCGPRYTVHRRRCRTTASAPRCARSPSAPNAAVSTRRRATAAITARPIACPACGPRSVWVAGGTRPRRGAAPATRIRSTPRPMRSATG